MENPKNPECDCTFCQQLRASHGSIDWHTTDPRTQEFYRTHLGIDVTANKGCGK